MSIYNITEKQLGEALSKGLLDDVRREIVHKIMLDIEKEVLAAIDKVVEQLKGHIVAYHKTDTDQLLVQVNIDGVKQNGSSHVSTPLHTAPFATRGRTQDGVFQEDIQSTSYQGSR